MNNDYIKIKNCLDESILIQINELSYMQNLRNGIEFYDESKTNEFFDSIMEYILLNDIDIRFKKFIVFWIDYVVNHEAQILVNINKKKCVGRSILLAKTLSIISENKTPIIFLLPYVSKPYDTFIFKYINIDKKFIIFCTNKNTIKSVAHRLIKNETCKIENISYRMQALINYIETNIGSEFEFINFLKNGIAVHFSEIDSYIRRQIEIIFNEENDIKGLICTSTLLQGVNLNAQNLIMIYGNKFSAVGNVDIDYRNLIGRSARLGINIQGNIYNITCNKKYKKIHIIC